MEASTKLRSVLGKYFPSPVIDSWERQGIVELLPVQEKAIAAGCLNGVSCLVSSPTSSGKTFVGEVVCIAHMLNLRRALYLVPFKALAEEKFLEFRRKYSIPGIDAKIIVSTSDRREQDRRLSEGDFGLGILTYEKLSALLVSNPNILIGAGALVVDEVQFVSDETRGAELELLLTRARQIAPNLQIVAISAVVSELNGFDSWLGLTLIQDDHRPVPLREGVIAPSGIYQYVEWSGKMRSPGSEKMEVLSNSDSAAAATELVTRLLRTENAQVLAFVGTVARTGLVAKRIAEANESIPTAKKTKLAVSQLEPTENLETLLSCLDHSIAFHSADLTLDERLTIEEGFRSGEIRCLVSTSTLSMGVNLPASAVVIVDYKKWGKQGGRWHETPISVAEYRNMSGRAGRFGLRSDVLGTSFLLSDSFLGAEGMIKTYLHGGTEPLESALLKQPLDVRLLRILASGLCDTADGLCRFLLRTFAACSRWKDETSRQGLRERIDESVNVLTAAKLLAEVRGKLKCSQLGSVCASSGLRVDTFASLCGLVSARNTSVVDISFIAAGGEDTGCAAVSLRFSTWEHNNRTNVFLRELTTLCESTKSPLTEVMLAGLNGGERPDYDTAQLLKYQSAAIAFVNGIATDTIENQFGASAAKVRNIGSMCSWLSDTAAKVAWSNGLTDEAKEYERIAERFSYGCSDAALALAQVPYRMHRSEREEMVRNGYGSLQSVVDATSEDIARMARISRIRVQGLQKKIVELLGPSLDLQRAHAIRLKACGYEANLLEALYSAKGRLLEQAIADVLVDPFCPLQVSRIGSQNEGEADLRFLLGNGRNGIAQVTAKDNQTDRIGLIKACSVLQQSPELKPEVLICFGRPGFDDKAIAKAKAHVAAGRNFKLIPISSLAELYVQFHENKVTAAEVQQFFESRTGHLSLGVI